MNEIYIYTDTSLIRRVMYSLLNNNYHFVIVYNYKMLSTSNKTIVSIKNEIQLNCFIKEPTDLLKSTIITSIEMDICFITLPVKTYSFKRLWVVEKHLMSIIKNTHKLIWCIFFENMHNTSMCINIYNRVEEIIETAKNKVAIFLLPSGYGDIFRHAYIFQKFIKEKQKLGKQVFVLHNNPGSMKIAKILFKDCENLYLTQFDKQLELCKQIRYEEIYSMWDIDYLSATRAKDISEYLLGFFYKDMSTLNIDCSFTPVQIIENLRQLKKNKILVGIQFNTSHHNANYPRNFPLELAEKFVKMCNLNDIALVNLTSGYDLEVNLDCKNIDILAIPGIVKMLDIVISIDSFGGHLASCYNVPCIVLFNCVYSFSMSVIKNNFNIVSSVGDMSSIKPEVIYETMNAILQGKIKLPKEVSEKYDILNAANTLIV